MPMTTSPAGRAALTRREGLRLHAYLDSVKVPTIGCGHTGRMSPPPVKMGDTITAAQADAYLTTDLLPTETTVNALVKVRLSQHQFDALVSLVFNIGAPNFSRSTVLRVINEGNYIAAANAFLLWNRPPEIVGRRHDEVQQFLTPDGIPPVENSVPSGADNQEADSMRLPWTRKLDQILAGLAILASSLNTLAKQGATMATKDDIAKLNAANAAEATAFTAVLAQIQLDAQTNHDLLQQIATGATPDADIEQVTLDMQNRQAGIVKALAELNSTVSASGKAPDAGTTVAGSAGDDTASGAQGNDSLGSSSTAGSSGNDTLSTDTGSLPQAATSSSSKGKGSSISGSSSAN